MALGTALRDIKQLYLKTLPMPADANININTNTRTQKYHAVISSMEQVSSTQKVNNMQFHRFSFFLSILKSLRNDLDRERWRVLFFSSGPRARSEKVK